jgi:aminotransferase in exopolysaccharide biosynthesis
MSNFIPLSVPWIKGNEWKYVKECLDSEWVSSAGKFVDRFEQDICHFTGARFAIACVNGTSALQIGLRIAGVRPGDAVIVPTLTFIAPVNVVRYFYADPIFMDCDYYYNLDTEKTKGFILNSTYYKNGSTFDKATGKRIAAIIPVHIFGNAVNLDPLIDICLERNIKVVEDATESLGTIYTEGRFAKRHTGTIGEIGCLSFNGNKIITSGGGGMILTDNPSVAELAKYLTTQAKDDELRYIHNETGYNFRLSNIQAALGVAQLENIQEFLQIKKRNYILYKTFLEGIPGLHLADVPDYARNNYWMYALQIQQKIYGRDRDQLMQDLFTHNIQTRPVWHLNHLQKPYKDCPKYKIEKALGLLERTLNLPCSVGLNESDIRRIIDLLA